MDIGAALSPFGSIAARRSEHGPVQRCVSCTIRAIYESWIGIEKLADARDIIVLCSLVN